MLVHCTRNMKILLTKDMLVREVKTAFRSGFPYLKLEFFAGPETSRHGEPNSEKLPDHFRLGNLARELREGLIELNEQDTVAEVEAAFSRRSLTVQVCRKTLFSWISAHKTRDLSLQIQNKKGRVASEALYDYEVLL